MESLIAELKDKIHASNKQIFIAISGHGAAGKPSFAKKLCKALNVPYNYLNTDSYIIKGKYLDNTYASFEVDDENIQSKITACMPIRHELSSLYRDIQLLKNGNDLRTIDKPWDPSKVLNGRMKVNIIEGMSVAFLDPFDFDLSIYIYTDAKTEFHRRKNRDVLERGRDLNNLINTHVARRHHYDIFMHHLKDKFQYIVDDSSDKFVLVK